MLPLHHAPANRQRDIVYHPGNGMSNKLQDIPPQVFTQDRRARPAAAKPATQQRVGQQRGKPRLVGQALRILTGMPSKSDPTAQQAAPPTDADVLVSGGRRRPRRRRALRGQLLVDRNSRRWSRQAAAMARICASRQRARRIGNTARALECDANAGRGDRRSASSMPAIAQVRHVHRHADAPHLRHRPRSRAASGPRLPRAERRAGQLVVVVPG